MRSQGRGLYDDVQYTLGNDHIVIPCGQSDVIATSLAGGSNNNR